jgi:predicted Zn-dependent protease
MKDYKLWWRGLGLIYFFLSVSFLFTGCATSSKEIKSEVEAQLMSEEDEIKFGYYVDAVVSNEFPVLKDERLTQKIVAVGNSLVKHSLRPDLKFTFKVLNTETVNAFSGPGGFVYVTVGLLDKLESKDELAAILGHEIGHVCARHPIKAWKSAQKISRTLTIIDIAAIIAGLPPVAGAGGDIIANVGQRAAHLASMIIYQGYSRGYEYQADELGLQEMYKSGYDPEAMVRVFEKFIKLREEEGRGKGLTILSSHPHLEERIQHARHFIFQMKNGK